jgi:hypothetical protein
VDITDESQIVRWAGPAFVFCSLVLIPWTVYLGYSLPSRQVSHHNDIAWVGFDALEIVVLGATGYFGLRRSRYLAVTSASAATLLVVDAWFDILTSPKHQIAQAILLAVVIELPLAAICGWLSYHTEAVMERQINLKFRRLGRGGRAPRRR